MLHKFVLRELVVGNQVAKLILQVSDFATFTVFTVDADLVVVVFLEYLIHTSIQNSQRLYNGMGGLKNAASRQKQRCDQRCDNNHIVPKVLALKKLHIKRLNCGHDADEKCVAVFAFNFGALVQRIVNQRKEDRHNDEVLFNCNAGALHLGPVFKN